MEKQIEETVAVCDLVRGHKRSPKKLWLSFDEWNVWYRARSGDATNGHGQEAPHLLEEVYNLEDALLVGGLVNSLLRHADRVKVACRDLSKPHVVEINWQDKTPGQVLVATLLTGTDLKASNTFETPQRVAPQPFSKPATGDGRTRFEVPPRSYTAIQWSA